MKRIRTVGDLQTVSAHVEQVLTLFSGGLDSTYVLELLAKLPVRITAMAVNLGDGIDVEKLKAITRHYEAELVLVDACDEFARDHAFPAIRAQAKYLDMYPVSSSLSRPVIGRHAVRLAQELGCGAIIHTANQSQNSLRRLNGAIASQGYEGYFGTPYEYSAISREDKIAKLSLTGVHDFSGRMVSGDSNLWCREFESGILDNPEQFAVPQGLYTWTRQTETSHRPSDLLEVRFEAGTPVVVNGEAMEPTEMIARLNHWVGAYGIGRYEGLEHLDEGEKVLEVREAPAACLLMNAYKHLETAVHDVALLREKATQERLWTLEAVEGRWDSALHHAASAFIERTAKKVTGQITYRLSEGRMTVESIIANEALYLTDRDAWEISVANSRSQRELFIPETSYLQKIA